MAREIINLTLSQRSLDALERIKSQVGMAKVGAYLISVGHVYSLILGNSDNASRVINIGLSEWEEYQAASNWGGLAGSWVKTTNAIIQREACRLVLDFPEGQEKEFWRGLAGEGCNQ